MKPNHIKNNDMFTIDLLKGQGIPQRTGPAGLFIVAVTVLVPVALVILFYVSYHDSKVVTNIKQQDVLKLEENISKLSGALEIKRSLERQKFLYNTCLSEVKSTIQKYTQWSPVLGLLLEEMPSSVVLKGLEVEHERVIKDAKGGIPTLNSKETIVTKLILQISNKDQGDYVEEVKDFRNRLYASPVFGSKLDNIIFSRRAEQNDGVEIISYQIECLFKPES